MNVDDQNNGSIYRGKKAAKSVGRASGVSNYSREDVNVLINLVEKIRPIGKNGWNRLTEKYNSTVNQNRNPECLRRKFLSFIQPRLLTSKQEVILAEVLDRAKKIHREITSANNPGLDNENDDAGYSNDTSDSENEMTNQIENNQNIFSSSNIQMNGNSNNIYGNSQEMLRGLQSDTDNSNTSTNNNNNNNNNISSSNNSNGNHSNGVDLSHLMSHSNPHNQDNYPISDFNNNNNNRNNSSNNNHRPKNTSIGNNSNSNSNSSRLTMNQSRSSSSSSAAATSASLSSSLIITPADILQSIQRNYEILGAIADDLSGFVAQHRRQHEELMAVINNQSLLHRQFLQNQPIQITSAIHNMQGRTAFPGSTNIHPNNMTNNVNGNILPHSLYLPERQLGSYESESLLDNGGTFHHMVDPSSLAVFDGSGSSSLTISSTNNNNNNSNSNNSSSNSTINDNNSNMNSNSENIRSGDNTTHKRKHQDL